MGGHYRVWQAGPDGDIGGFESELLELAPAERIVFQWGLVGPKRESEPTYDSRLTVTFEDAPGGGTTLTLVHERLEELYAARPDLAEKFQVGWEAVLDKLSQELAAEA